MEIARMKYLYYISITSTKLIFSENRSSFCRHQSTLSGGIAGFEVICDFSHSDKLDAFMLLEMLDKPVSRQLNISNG